MIRVAVLVDGGFYRKRATILWGKKTAEAREKELYAYCMAHCGENYLYRVFYYDCPPIGRRSVYHPLTKKNIDLDKSDTFIWAQEFIEQLKKARKVALRLGRIAETSVNYSLTPDATKRLCNKSITVDDLTERDFKFNISQKGVDMKIGVDISSLAYKKQVDQIVLIAGDSDFVPAAKLARREGIDFILDPMWQDISDDLFEHIDGLNSQWKNRNRTT